MVGLADAGTDVGAVVDDDDRGGRFLRASQPASQLNVGDFGDGEEKSCFVGLALILVGKTTGRVLLWSFLVVVVTRHDVPPIYLVLRIKGNPSNIFGVAYQGQSIAHRSRQAYSTT